MIPYYQQDGITIYHGDCRDVLPSISADVCLTDFPYGIGLDYGASYQDTEENLGGLVGDVVPLLKGSAPVVAFTCGIDNWWRYPTPTWVLCWYMANACSSTGRWGFNQWQPVLVYGTDPYLTRQMGRRPDVIITAAPNNGVDKRRGHPCDKPTEAWRKILLRVSPHDTDVIVDPFMGSGTTLDVAKYSGRRAIGIDVSERYCEIAAKRLAQGVLFGADPDCILDGTDQKTVPHQPPSPPVTPSKTASPPLTAPEQGVGLSKRLKLSAPIPPPPTDSGTTGLGEEQGEQATGADCILDCTDGSAGGVR